MSTDCCTYGCTRAKNCPAGSALVERLLHGVPLPELEPMCTPLRQEGGGEHVRGDGLPRATYLGLSDPTGEPAPAWIPLTRCDAVHLLLGVLPFFAIGLGLVGALIWMRWGSELVRIVHQWLG